MIMTLIMGGIGSDLNDEDYFDNDGVKDEENDKDGENCSQSENLGQTHFLTKTFENQGT